MAHPDPTTDPPPSISAAELRRRLLSSTPPPVSSAPSGLLDFDALMAGAQSSKGGGARNSGIIRLTMPSTHGPVAASSLPPVTESPPAGPQPPPGYRPRASSSYDPASMGGGGAGSTLGAMPGTFPPPPSDG